LKTVKDASPSGVRIPDSPLHKIYVANALNCIVFYPCDTFPTILFFIHKIAS